jgi:hypothetical protein
MNSSKRLDGEAKSMDEMTISEDEMTISERVTAKRAAGLPTSQPSPGPDKVWGNLEEENAIRRKMGLPLLSDVDEMEEESEKG